MRGCDQRCVKRRNMPVLHFGANAGNQATRLKEAAKSSFIGQILYDCRRPRTETSSSHDNDTSIRRRRSFSNGETAISGNRGLSPYYGPPPPPGYRHLTGTYLAPLFLAAGILIQCPPTTILDPNRQLSSLELHVMLVTLQRLEILLRVVSRNLFWPFPKV